MSKKQGHALQDNGIYTSQANEAFRHIGQCQKLLLQAYYCSSNVASRQQVRQVTTQVM